MNRLRTLLPALGLMASVVQAGEPQALPPEQVVLERAASARDPAVARLRALRQELGAAPQDLAVAQAYARAAIALGRNRSDPRYFGQARAALSPWLAQPDPPLEVRLLRATLAQREHRFDDAAADLDVVLQREPRHAQAHLARATILMVAGRPRDAVPHCAALSRISTQLVAVSCAAQVASLLGHATEAQAALAKTLAAPAAEEGAEVRVWALTHAAEIAARQGLLDVARPLFEAALKLEREQPEIRTEYLRVVYSDVLLDHGQAATVRELLAGETSIDALLLRLVLAEKALPGAQADYAAHRAQLQARFELQRARGETLYQRDEAHYLLDVEGDPARALPVAVANWSKQREPADARLLLRAALAMKDRAAAAPVLDWMQQTGIEDPALKDLAAQLGAAS